MTEHADLGLDLLAEQATTTIQSAIENGYVDRSFMTTAFGPNGIVLLDLVRRIDSSLPVYFLDTGYHFPETLELMEFYRDNGWNIQVARSPVDQTNQPLHEISKELCCGTNKVEVLNTIFDQHPGWLWITAISRDQTPQRAKAPLFQVLDTGHAKLAPMISWTLPDVWSYIRKNNLRYNELHDKGYPSIGCAPCTSRVRSGEDARAGRWRGTDKKECGLHTKTGNQTVDLQFKTWNS